MIEIKEIAKLLACIRRDNNLVKQDLEKYREKVNELRELLKEEEVLNTLNGIEDLFVIIDMNNGFTIEGIFKNPYMEALINPISEVAQEFAGNPNRFVVAVNEGHHEESVEFKTFPVHCKIGDSEVEYAEALRWATEKHPVFEKNTTMAAFAPGYTDFLDLLPNLKRVVFGGGVTDICILEAALTTKKYFDQNDRDINVIVPTNLVDTYEIVIEHKLPNGRPIILNNKPFIEVIHPRAEHNEMAFKILNQAGVETPKEYIKRK